MGGCEICVDGCEWVRVGVSGCEWVGVGVVHQEVVTPRCLGKAYEGPPFLLVK